MYCEFIFSGLRTDPQSVKSMEGIDIAWTEEANYVSQGSLDLLVPTVRQEGSELWFSWNLVHEDDPVHKMLVIEGRPGAIVKKVGYHDNPFFPEVLQKEMEYDREHNRDKYLHVWEGEPLRISDAIVFSGRYKIEDFDLDESANILQGADWGFSQDPTVLVQFYIDHDTRRIFIWNEVYKIGVDIDDIPDLFDQVPGARGHRIKADSSRPETISYLKKKGFLIDRAHKGKGSIEDGIEWLKSFEIIVHPRCKHTASELGTYSYKIDPKTEEILPILEDKHNHCIDSIRYGSEEERSDTINSYLNHALVVAATKISFGATNDAYSWAQVVFGVRYDESCSAISVRQGLRCHDVAQYKNKTMVEFASDVAMAIKKYKPTSVFICVNPANADGLADRLRALGFMAVIDVNLADKADDPIYYNLRSYCYSELNKWLKAGGGLPERLELVQDLSNPTFTHDVKKRLVIEDEEKIVARGLRRPVSGESLVLTFSSPLMADEKKTVLSQAEQDWHNITGGIEGNLAFNLDDNY